MFAPQLPTLAVGSTVAELPCHATEVAPSTLGKEVLVIFERNPDLPGVLVGQAPMFVGLVSQRTFFHRLSRPFSHEIYLARPIQVLLGADDPGTLFIESTTSINEAARAALSRPAPSAFEPLVIRRGDGRLSVVDFHVLLLAQVELLAIANDTIEHQKRTADHANHAKGIFLATMSHEIRTPMNAVIGLTDLVLDTPLTSDQRECLRTVKSSANGLLSLLNDILDFSKIEAGKFELDPVDFDLRDTFADALRSLAPLAVQKGLELILHIHTDVPQSLRADANRLRQILVNLVNNAIKFTPSGEICVRVDAPAPAGASGLIMLHMAVEDTGKGIAPDKQRLIFEPFRQADSSITRRFGGTGLGLTICQRLAEAMGGRLWLESPARDHRGSIFHFTIAAHPGAAVGAPTCPPAIRNLRVLVIDDNANCRQSLVEILEAWHFRTAAVPDLGSARAAIQQAAADRAPFQLALLDVHLPARNPLSAVDELKSMLSEPRAVIPLLPIRCSSADAQAYGGADLALHVIKPVRPSELFNAILRACGCADESFAEPEHPSLSAVPPFRSLQILVAEDNLVNQTLVVRLLQKLGHSARVVDTGRNAVNAVAREAFDLVLMDVQMPDMDGFEATARIRKDERSTGRHLPIVALTAHAMKGDRERCLSHGMDGYVAKPIQVEELRAAIGAAIRSDALPAGAHADPSAGLTDAVDASFSFSAALKHVGGDEAILRELADVFCQEVPQQLHELYRAFETDDRAAVRRIAHALKGASDIFDARECVAAAWQLESLAADGKNAGPHDALERLDHHLQRLLIALQTLSPA